MEILLGVYSVFSASGVNMVRVFFEEEYILVPALAIIILYQEIVS